MLPFEMSFLKFASLNRTCWLVYRGHLGEQGGATLPIRSQTSILQGMRRNERGGISSRRRFNSLPLAASGDKKDPTSSLQEIEHQRRILSVEMWREKASLTGRMRTARTHSQ